MTGERLRAELARQRAELNRVAQAAQQLTAQARSADQLVSVRVNARGLLTELTIDPVAMRRYRAGRLADEIVALVAAADEKIANIRNRTVAATVQSLSDYSDD